jgi:hypothetical protein
MQRALYASVRLKVEDSTGFGYGTGTIIDRHDDEALVVTCGHIFRQSQGKGKISADLFAPGATSPVAGQLIAFDLDRDIALVSIRPGVAIEPVTVAGPSFSIKPHDGAFSIGCDKGAEPSIRETRITAVNKYKGAPNITAAGQPVDGRSGGGLFTTDGLLIGICNAADPADDEGLYAALASIHWQLDQIGQSEIYRRGETASLAASASPASTESPLAAREPSVPDLPARMPGLPSANATPTNSIPTSLTSATIPAPAQTAGNDVEVIMILRSKSNPQRQSEVIVLDNASPALIQQIAAQGRPATTAQPATLPNRLPENPIVRAQSAD